jgi:hypothetical protein
LSRGPAPVVEDLVIDGSAGSTHIVAGLRGPGGAANRITFRFASEAAAFEHLATLLAWCDRATRVTYVGRGRATPGGSPPS